MASKETLYAVTYDGPLKPYPGGTSNEFIIPGDVLDHKDDLTLRQGQPEVVSKTVFEKLQSIAQDYRATETFTFDDDYKEPEPPTRKEVKGAPITEDRGINEPPKGITDTVGSSEPPGEKQAVEGSGVAEADSESDR